MRTEEQKNKRLAFYICGLSLNEKRGIFSYDMPAYWASYLINGDSSGLEQSDIELCDLKTKDLGSCVGVSENTFFGRYAGLGCDLATYKFRKI